MRVLEMGVSVIVVGARIKGIGRRQFTIREDAKLTRLQLVEEAKKLRLEAERKPEKFMKKWEGNIKKKAKSQLEERRKLGLGKVWERLTIPRTGVGWRE